MQRIGNTLYVTTQSAYAHLESETVRVDIDHQKRLQVPLHHVGAIVCFGNVLVSPALIHRFADDGKPIVMLSSHGRFKARIEGPVSGNILLRQAQHRHAADPGFCLATAGAIVAGKVRNARQLLLRAARESSKEDAAIVTEAASALGNATRRIPTAVDLDTVRGIEGEAARAYFAALPRLVRADARDVFPFDRRTRRPPRDRMNALLSFLYSMLMNDCRSAVETAGLDPQLGFLHAVRPGRAALALDLMEEFRVYLADRLALKLVNRQQLGTSDFDAFDGGAVLLNESGRKTVIAAYQERKEKQVVHPLLDTPMTIGLVPFLQARLMARALRGDMDGYLPFMVR